MMSIKVYSLLRTYGWELFEQYVTAVIDLGRQFAALIRGRPDLELAMEPDCNIVCFRYRPSGMEEEEADRCNEQIRRALLEDGTFYIVQTRLRGRTWLRVTLTNAFTTQGDLEALLEAVARYSLIVNR